MEMIYPKVWIALYSGFGKQLPIPVGDGPYLQTTSTRDSRVFGYCIDCRRHPLCPISTIGVDVLISPVRPSTVQMSKVWTLWVSQLLRKFGLLHCIGRCRVWGYGSHRISYVHKKYVQLLELLFNHVWLQTLYIDLCMNREAGMDRNRFELFDELAWVRIPTLPRHENLSGIQFLLLE